MFKFIAHNVLPIVLSISLLACKHEHPNQKEQGQSEEKSDYVIATLNGVQWESCSSDFWLLDTDSEIYDDAWFCYGLFYCVDTNSFDLGFESALPLETGVYSLNGGATNGTVILHYPSGFIDTFKTDSNHTGMLEIIEIDTLTEEIYGISSFECYCPELDSTVTVTECVFRVNYTDYR